MILLVQNDFLDVVKDEWLTFLGFHLFEDLSIKMGMHENSKFGWLLWRVILKFPLFANLPSTQSVLKLTLQKPRHA